MHSEWEQRVAEGLLCPCCVGSVLVFEQGRPASDTARYPVSVGDYVGEQEVGRRVWTLTSSFWPACHPPPALPVCARLRTGFAELSRGGEGEEWGWRDHLGPSSHMGAATEALGPLSWRVPKVIQQTC